MQHARQRLDMARHGLFHLRPPSSSGGDGNIGQ
jgi:hypothetical protein